MTHDTPGSSSTLMTTSTPTDYPAPKTACQLGYHSWELRVPHDNDAYAHCMSCGRNATPEQAEANRRWQDSQ